MPTATIEQNHQREYERFKEFERFEARRRFTDEITDMSERLAAPMRNVFDYELRADGELWFQGEPIVHVFNDGIRAAEAIVKENPHFIVELHRRHIERQEYDDMRQLAAGGEGEPDVLVVISTTPDAVLEGVQLNAYDPERKKALVRIFRRTEAGIEATSLSLDRSDRDGLNAVAETFGQTIDPEAGSEDILAMRFWGYQDQFADNISRTVRTMYDDVLSEKFGGNWYAGRQPSLITDAKEFIETQPDLIEQHMEVIMALKKNNSGRVLEEKLEDARYNLAAALTRRMRGDVDSSSLAEAGDMARANGERYDGDCPTGTTDVTTEQSLSKLGIGNEEHLRCVTCPICGAKGVDGIVSANTITCSKKGCTVDRKTGAILRGPGGVQKGAQKTDMISISSKKEPKQPSARKAFGSHVEERTVHGIGGAERVVYDRNQNKVIARVTNKGFAAPL